MKFRLFDKFDCSFLKKLRIIFKKNPIKNPQIEPKSAPMHLIDQHMYIIKSTLNSF